MTENKLVDPHKSSIGNLDANKVVLIMWLVALALMIYPFSAPLSFICPLIFMIMEKKSNFVKFYANQCMVYSIIFAVLNIGIGIISILPLAVDKSQQTAEIRYIPLVNVAFLPYLLGLVFLCITVLVIVKSNSYEAYKLPITGPVAEKKFLAD